MKKIIALLSLSILAGCAYQKSQYVLDVENAPLPANDEAKSVECVHIYGEIDRNNSAMAKSYQDGTFSMKYQHEKDARNEALSIRRFKINCPSRSQLLGR